MSTRRAAFLSVMWFFQSSVCLTGGPHSKTSRSYTQGCCLLMREGTYICSMHEEGCWYCHVYSQYKNTVDDILFESPSSWPIMYRACQQGFDCIATSLYILFKGKLQQLLSFTLLYFLSLLQFLNWAHSTFNGIWMVYLFFKVSLTGNSSFNMNCCLRAFQMNWNA